MSPTRKRAKRKGSRVRIGVRRSPSKAVTRGPTDKDFTKLLTIWIDEARDGSPEAAEKVLRHFCQCVELEEPIPSVLLHFLRNAFLQAIDSKGETRVSVDKGLGLTRKKHRPAGQQEDREILIVCSYLLLSKTAASLSAAKTQVASKYHTTERSVERLAKKWRDWLLLTDQEIAVLVSTDDNK